jgi:hypothetical protein
MSVKSLWGDLSSLERLRTPKEILVEQANLLSEATQGAIVGVVDSRVESTLFGRDTVSGQEFVHDLDVRVPSLNNYTYTLLTVAHGIDLYPVEVSSETYSVGKCATEEAYIELLLKILSSQRTKGILSKLLSQA